MSTYTYNYALRKEEGPETTTETDPKEYDTL